MLADGKSIVPPMIVIGSGSNLLFRGDYEGTVVHSAILGIQVAISGDSVRLTCGSGETMDSVVAYAVEHGFYGAENLSLIPGEVGASAVQNIGAYGVEAKDIIESVRVCEIETRQCFDIAAEDCQFGYRNSRFKHEWAGRFVITAVTYKLSRKFTPHLDYGNIRAVLADRGISKPTAAQLREAICKIRRDKLPDPRVMGNAGSFFMNPVVPQEVYERIARENADVPHFPAIDGQVKIPAAWLIEQSGWKGRSLGRAAVHDKQPLVLVNRGGATPSEVLDLCQAVQQAVLQRFGIELHPEVIMI